MSSSQELEVKFLVADLGQIAARLQAQPARLTQARLYERNLRFDRPDGSLESSLQVLRLRQDTAARLTYKGPGVVRQGVQVRTELEVQVDDFGQAQALLEALGYQVSWMYEKYRAVYQLGQVAVTLDEMPYGDFVEIEGPDAASIQAASQVLQLAWPARVTSSYAGLFWGLQQALGLQFRDLTFENFKALQIDLGLLGLGYADG
ncbi:MAG: class IV adenylate cyclase [Anaerolineales bacterium]|nr:class IV adenylate cyclase [Anaerolineales bacterium]